MKKFAHALVLAVFGFGCWVTWIILTMAPLIRRSDPVLPRFTTLCVSLRPVVVVLPIAAVIYCLWVWSRKSDRVPSWVGFFAATMGALVVMTLPAMLAAYVALLHVVNTMAATTLAGN